MTKAEIYLSQNAIDSLFYGKTSEIFNQNDAAQQMLAGQYEKVAEIAVPTKFYGSDPLDILEKVYESTQNLDKPWNSQKPCRSLSVGDIVILDNVSYIVASCGFDKMEVTE
jgi:hypothetical protein